MPCLHLAQNNKCALSIQHFWVLYIYEGTAALVAHATSVLAKQEQGRCWQEKRENRASGMPRSGVLTCHQESWLLQGVLQALEKRRLSVKCWHATLRHSRSSIFASFILSLSEHSHASNNVCHTFNYTVLLT